MTGLEIVYKVCAILFFIVAFLYILGANTKGVLN